MTLCEKAASPPRRRREWIGIAGILQAVTVLLVLACAAPTAQAAEHRYKTVRVTDRTATFAVDNLAGRVVLSARLTATGARSRRIAAASVRRAVKGARTRSGRLRVVLPRSWRPSRRAGRKRMTLRIRTRRRAAAPEKVLWKADAESAMASEWASSSSVPAAASPPSPDPSRIAQSAFRAQGQKSYRFEMRDGDDSFGERAELGQAMPAVAGYEDLWFRAGEERWIAMQYYLPADWPSDDTWQTVLQIKPVSPGGGGPSIGLDAGGDKLKFYGNSNVWGSTAGNIFDGAGSLSAGSYPVTRGRWIKLTWHIVFSADPGAGSLEVLGDLADGQGMRTLVPRRSRATMKYQAGVADPVHLRVGIYRDPAMTATASLFVDGITVATTRAAAEANAYRPA